jgi:hypothetical protein
MVLLPSHARHDAPSSSAGLTGKVARDPLNLSGVDGCSDVYRRFLWLTRPRT